MRANLRLSMLRSALPRALIGVVFVVVAMAFLSSVVSYWSSVRVPPVPVDAIMLSEEGLDIPLYNAVVHGRRYVPINLSIEFDDWRQLSYYGLLVLDDIALPVSHSPAAVLPGLTWTGSLIPLDEFEVIHIHEQVFREYPQFNGRIPDVGLRLGGIPFHPFHDGGTVGAILGVYGIVLILISTYRASSLERHPYYRALRRFGDETKIEAILAQAQEELATGKRSGRIIVTKNWIVVQGSAFCIMRKDDVVWIFQRRDDGLVTRWDPDRKVLVARDRLGGKLRLGGYERSLFQEYSALLDAAPWALAGYSIDNRIMWDKQRGQFIAKADARRAARSQPPAT